MKYNDFAKVYDKLMSNVPYEKWLKFIEGIWEKHGINPKIVLDLACGTGTMAVRLCKKGYDCIGIDNSSEMLSVAAAKADRANLLILFSRQDMTDYELFGTVDAIICLCDSVNYLTRDGDLDAMLERSRLFLEDGGIFIFDIVTLYKFENVIAGNTFSEIRHNAAYVMHSYYDSASRINEYQLTLFAKNKKTDCYDRYDEVHKQRAYSEDEVRSALDKAGFRLLNIYDERRFGPPAPDSGRLFFVCTTKPPRPQGKPREAKKTANIISFD